VFAEANDYDELFKYMPRPLLSLDKKGCFASCVNNNQQMATNNHSNNVERYEGHLRLNGNIFILKRALNMLCFMLTQSRVFN